MVNKNTLFKVAAKLKEVGALEIYSYATHGICSGESFYDNLNQSCLNRLFLSDSLKSKNQEKELKSKVTRVSLSSVIIQEVLNIDSSLSKI